MNAWHILGDRLIPLGPLSLVGFYMKPTKILTFSRVFPKGCHEWVAIWIYSRCEIGLRETDDSQD